MKHNFLKLLKRSLLLLFTFSLAIGVFIAPYEMCRVEAANKVELDEKSITLGMNNKYKIPVTNWDNVKLTYSSSNTKVATVNKNGLITTKDKVGSTKITVRIQKTKKKVGTFTVKVKKAVILSKLTKRELTNNNWDYFEAQARLWSDYTFTPGITPNDGKIAAVLPKDASYERNTYDDFEYIIFANLKAKYTYFSSDPSLLKITTKGVVTEVVDTEGVVDIIVKETYKKKTRVVGKFPVAIQDTAKFLDDGKAITCKRFSYSYVDSEKDEVISNYEFSSYGLEPSITGYNNHTEIHLFASKEKEFNPETAVDLTLLSKEQGNSNSDGISLPDYPGKCYMSWGYNIEFVYREEGTMYVHLGIWDKGTQTVKRHIGTVTLNFVDNESEIMALKQKLEDMYGENWAKDCSFTLFDESTEEYIYNEESGGDYEDWEDWEE